MYGVHGVERLWEQHLYIFYGVERLRKVNFVVLCGAGAPWELHVDVAWSEGKL